MSDLQRFGWAFSVIVTVALTVLLLGLVLTGPAAATTDPSPSPTATEPAPSCDPFQGFRDVTLQDGSPGCVVEVQAEPETFQAGVFGIAAGLLVLTATLFVTAARKG